MPTRTSPRHEPERRISRFDLAAQMSGVECHKDGGVVDEIPGAGPHGATRKAVRQKMRQRTQQSLAALLNGDKAEFEID